MSNIKRINLKEPPSTTCKEGQVIQTIILYRNFEDTNPFNTKIKKDNSYITNQQIFKKNFGFSIVGGVDSPKGSLGIFVKTICTNGVASRSGLLETGDEILSVNGISLRGKTHEESIKLLKKYGRCSLVLTIAKNRKDKLNNNSSSSIIETESSVCSDEIFNDKLDINNVINDDDYEGYDKVKNLKMYDEGTSESEKETNDKIKVNNDYEKIVTLEEEQYYQVIFDDDEVKECKEDKKSSIKNCWQQSSIYQYNHRKKFFFGCGTKKESSFNHSLDSVMKRIVILRRQNSKERLGLGVAIESDEENERVLCVTVEQIDEDSISHIQGLSPGDRIWQINGIDVHNCKRIECLSLFQCAPLLLNLVVSTPFKKIPNNYQLLDNIITPPPKKVSLEDKNSYNSFKANNSANQEVLENDYQTITTESSSFDKLPLSLSNIPQYLTTDYLCETVNYQMSSRKTDQPSPNSQEMIINKKGDEIENEKMKDSVILKNVNENCINMNKNNYSPPLTLINTSSSVSSISPDPHSPTHSEDSGFQNDHTSGGKSRQPSSPVPVPINCNKASAYNTTSTSPTRYRSVFERTTDSVEIGRKAEENKLIDNNKRNKVLVEDNYKMFNETADCFIKGRNSNSMYDYMDCKISKSQPFILNKIVLPTIKKSPPSVPPKPKPSTTILGPLGEDENCLKTNKIFNRASVIYNSEDNSDVVKLNDITPIKSSTKKVSTLIHKFQTGNIIQEDSDEEIENLSLNGEPLSSSTMVFERNNDAGEEIVLQEDFLIEQDRYSDIVNKQIIINNKQNFSLSKREISNENDTCKGSEDKYKSLAEKYREPSPIKEVLAPALKELLERDSNYKKLSSTSSKVIKTINNCSDKMNKNYTNNLIKEEEEEDLKSNNDIIISGTQTPPPTVEKFENSTNENIKIESCSSKKIFERNNICEKYKPIILQQQSLNISPLPSGRTSRSSTSTTTLNSTISSLSTKKSSLINLTQSQIDELQRILKDQYDDYEFFVVNMHRVAGIIDGSVGIILTGAESTNNFSTITVQRVITGSVADREGTLLKGDRLFFIQGKSTSTMTASDARKELKAEAQVVNVIGGRINKYKMYRVSSSLDTINDSENIFNSDPNLYKYDETPMEVILTKTTIGIGFSLDGGIDSSYGNRPIIIKRLFNGGEATKSGLLSAGDILEKIEDKSLEGMSYLDAWKILKGLPEGKIKLTIKKIQK
uniref:PDZ domain-containing protein n=1 Tax=Parastrongyloides trichosuri TaxID=131310 RepID=A0A0N4ZU25_PARTI